MSLIICHVNTTFIYKAGSCRRTYFILRALVREGYETILVVGRDFEPHPSWDFTGIRIVQFSNLVKYIDIPKEVIAWWQLFRFFKTAKPNIVHTHLAKAGVLARSAAWIAGVPYIIHTVHGPTFARSLHPFKRVLYRSIEWLMGFVTDQFVFVGNELKREYQRSGICSNKNAVVIRSGRPKEDYRLADGISVDRLQEVRRSIFDDTESVYIGYVARIVPSKDQVAAVHVLALVRSSGMNARLVLIGEAHLVEEKKYELKVRNLCRELSVDAYVHFTGYRSDVLLYMKAMDVMILTSRYEGLPNVAVEAGIVARPMVSFGVSGIHEVIENGETGYIVAQGDIEKMAERIVMIARDKNAASGMGAKARKKIEGLYDTVMMERQKLQLYDVILKQGTLRH